VGEFEIGVYGLGSLGGLDDLWEAEVFGHRGMVAVECVEKLFQGEMRAVDPTEKTVEYLKNTLLYSTRVMTVKRRDSRKVRDHH